VESWFYCSLWCRKKLNICHIGNEEGYLEHQYETMLVFEEKCGSADYHNEMNSLHYQEWFKRVFHHIPNKSAIVIDNALCHTMQDPETRNPNQSWKKDEIIDWLIQNEIEPPLQAYGIPTFHERFLKGDLIKMSQPNLKDSSTYWIFSLRKVERMSS
jgi:hypothetical protein